MGKSADVPDPPDYTALANTEGEINQELLLAQTYANRPNQITPWGTTTWSSTQGVDPATGDPVTLWNQEQRLTPALHNALYDQSDIARIRSNKAVNILKNRADTLGSDIDYSQFRDITDVGDPLRLRDRAEDAVMERLTSRLDPQFAERREQLEIQMRNRGLRPGDEAYEAEMDRLNRAETDAYQAAANEAIGVGRQEAAQLFGQEMGLQSQSAMLRQQEIAEELRRRMQPLEDVNAMVAGQGVQPPYAPGFSTAGMGTPPNLMGAANQTYNAQAQAYNANQAAQQGLYSGITNLAGIGLGFFSDRRLKRHIEHIGYWLGHKLYRYQYVWGPWAIGVMADEVNQDAVFMHPSGYAMVDYSAVRQV